MKSNPLLTAFILIMYATFRALFFPGTTVTGLINSIQNPVDPVTDAINNLNSTCTIESGAIDSLTSIARCIGALAKVTFSIAKAAVFLIYDIAIVIGLFLTLGFSPIQGAPLIINFFMSSMFIVLSVVTIIGFIPGED